MSMNKDQIRGSTAGDLRSIRPLRASGMTSTGCGRRATIARYLRDETASCAKTRFDPLKS